MDGGTRGRLNSVTNMPHRKFIDTIGRAWDVWTVKPELVERRRQDADDTVAIERRKHREYRVPLGERWLNGWLAFDGVGGKRRLAPVPANWTQMTDAELERLCQSAAPAHSTAKELVE
jgi:hypothetical protein